MIDLLKQVDNWTDVLQWTFIFWLWFRHNPWKEHHS